MCTINQLYIVDSENVGTKQLGLKNTNGVLVVYMVDNKLQMRTLKSYEKAIRVAHTGCKNALDFIIATELGSAVKTYGKETMYFIVSNDKGFDNVVNYWKSKNVKVKRVARETIAKVEKKKVITVTTAKEQEKEILKGLSEKEKRKIENVYTSYLNAKKKKYEVFYLVIENVLSKKHGATKTKQITDLYWNIMQR